MAEPLNDLQARLAALRDGQPERVEVEVEVHHRGTGPLHLNEDRKRGTAVIVMGRHGAEVRKQKWLQDSRRLSIWQPDEEDADLDLVTEDEAQDLIDPVGTMERLLTGAELVSDEAVTWQGRPVRLVTFRPSLPQDPNAPASEEHHPSRFGEEAKVWLDESGLPLALERSMTVRLGPVRVAERRTLTFRSADGRLLVDEVEDEYSGSALAVLRGQDYKKMTVTAAE